MGRKLVKTTHVAVSQKTVHEEEVLAAKAWAEFLLEEYLLEKQNELLLDRKRTTMKELTNHDKLNP